MPQFPQLQPHPPCTRIVLSYSPAGGLPTVHETHHRRTWTARNPIIACPLLLSSSLLPTETRMLTRFLTDGLNHQSIPPPLGQSERLNTGRVIREAVNSNDSRAAPRHLHPFSTRPSRGNICKFNSLSSTSIVAPPR